MSRVPEWEPSEVEFLYASLADHLATRIKSGDLPPRSRLPSEPELCDEYGVSMPTVRHALAILREQGLVLTLRGKGTFVREPENQADAP